MNTESHPQGNTRLHARVTGRVQGVGFRFFVQKNATRLGVSGWVRNRWNGSVEVLAEGRRRDLKILLQALQRGPRPNTTRTVDHDWLEATGEFDTFQIRRTR